MITDPAIMGHRFPFLLAFLPLHLQAIDTPSPIAPCGGVMVDPLMNPMALWTASAGALSYNVQFGGDPSFTSFQFEVTLPGTSSNISLWFDFHYYWRVRATDGISWSAWSSNCDFFTSTIPPPPAPVLSSPSCGTVNVISSQNFSWNYATGALNYEMQLATNADFSPATSYFTTNMSQLVNGLAPGQTFYWRVRGESLGGWGLWSIGCNFFTQTAATTLNLDVFLQGPLDPGTLLMGDQLRGGGLLPSSEPYTALGFTGMANSGAQITPALLSTTGSNAAVDWILVEARHATTNAILRSWSMLVQRDGDAMMPDGAVPNLAFPMAQVRIAVRHRNHLGTMAFAPITMGGAPVTLDLTQTSTMLQGTEPTATVSGRRALWCGDTNGDGILRYVGDGNDRDPILMHIGGSVPTATASGYDRNDVNMDAVVRYVGTANDRDAILVNIGGSVPTATRTAQLP